MCTAIAICGNKHYFGRNLDLSYHYSESVTITPRKYLLEFCDGQKTNSHYAIIGIATVIDNYPLYYDAVNEYGLCIAAINFPGNAVYRKRRLDKTNIASYELIPWLLSQHTNVGAVKQALSAINITDEAFSEDFPPTPLHWMISDRDCAIVLESTSEGIKVYDNPARVLTNNPPFPFQLYNLRNYLNITSMSPSNRFAQTIDLHPYSLGMGGIGLPGDLSSTSRFVRATFHLHNAEFKNTDEDEICQFFHILNSVSQVEGTVDDNGKWAKTVYSSCCNADEGVYYYTTYENQQITTVSLKNYDLNCDQIVSYPLRTKPNFYYED